LVEDNEINQQVAQEILESAGLIVSLANNGEEGVRAVKEKVYDVVLMDIQMPLMNGYEATKGIRNWEGGKQKSEVGMRNGENGMRPPARKGHRGLRPGGNAECGMRNEGKDPIPIIAMTAHAMAGDEEKSLKAGMNGHVAKPIDPDQLFATLRKWIRPIEDRINDRSSTASEAHAAAQTVNLDENQLPQSLAGFDLTEGLQRLQGNQKLYKKLLVDFAANYSEAAIEIRKCLDDRDLKQAHHLVHNLKGLAGNLAATNIHSAAVELEKLIKNDDHRHMPSPEMLEQKVFALDQALNQGLGSARTLDIAIEDKPVQPGLEKMAVLPAELAQDAARRIRNAAQMGDVMQLIDIAEELKSKSEDYGPISDSIVQMASDFEFDNILKLADFMEE
jgi:two-component system sensor histidine kinase/response regulator